MENIDDIVQRNIELVPFVLTKLGLLKYKEEYIDIGWLGLVWGARNYDKTKGAESTFLYKSIKLYLMGELLYKTKKKRTGFDLVSLDFEYIDDDGDIFTLQDMIGKNYADDVIDRHDLEQCIRDVIKDMDTKYTNKTHGEIIKDYYGFDTERLSTNAIVKKYNITRTTLTNIKNKFKKKLIKKYGLEDSTWN